MNRTIYNWLEPFHRKYRQEKCRLFFSELQPQPGDSLLDVGGASGSISEEFGALYSFFHEVYVVNLCFQGFSAPSRRHIRFVQADACALPYANRSIDWVFSNAVIAHV